MSEQGSDGELARWLLEVHLDTIPSAVLRRLIAEVRHDEAEAIQGYNRTHNRHNRSGGTSGNPGTYNRSHNRHNRGM